MIILGIETSCDETAAAVLEKRTDGSIHILSNVIASSATMQAKYGGIIPEQAAREQIKSIIPVIEEALRQAFPNVIPLRHHEVRSTLGVKKGIQKNIDPRFREDDKINKIDAIAVTYGPGLIGSLLVGVETAKTLAIIWDKPLIPVNHLLGHFWANFINKQPVVSSKHQGKNKKILTTNYILPTTPSFPCIGLLVSGGHTDLVLFKDEQNYEYLGGTRDDAAGECFDKCARLLGLPYPGGPEISKLAEKGAPKAFDLPRPMIHSKDFDFSFSGLKTAVANICMDSRLRGNDKDDKLADLAASIEQAIVDVLVKKTIAAAQKYNVEHIMIAGGVAANQKLVNRLQVAVDSLNPKIKLHVPSANLCTDNAAMIASRAFFLPRRKAGEKPIDPLRLQAEPNLGLQ